MIRVRRMTADDLPQVLEIERICFSDSYIIFPLFLAIFADSYYNL